MGKTPFDVGRIVRLREARPDILPSGDLCGLVMQTRTRAVHVFFPDAARGFWLPPKALTLLSPLDPSVPRRIRRVVALFRMTGAKGWEIDLLGEERVEARYQIGAFDDRLLDQLRDYLGADLHEIVIEPGGRAFMTLTLIFENR